MNSVSISRTSRTIGSLCVSICMALVLIYGTWTHAVASAPKLPYRIESLSPALQTTAQKYFEARLGPTATLEQLRRIAEQFYRRGDIHRLTFTEDGQRRILLLEPKLFIGNIHVHGDSALSSRTIRDEILNVRSSKQYYDSTFDYAAHIRRLYAEHGYPEAKVTVKVQEIREARHIDLTLTVEEGPAYRIGKVTLHGQPKPFSRSYVFATLALESGDVLSRHLIAKGVDVLEKRYQNAGYRGARVLRVAYEDAIEDRIVDIDVHLERGPYFDFRFITQKYFFLDRDSILLDVIDVESEKRFSAGYLDTAIDRLREFYRNYGYLDVTVSTQNELSDDASTRTITFSIEKGDRHLLRSVRIETGNGQLATSLRKYLPSMDLGKAYKPEAVERMARSFVDAMQADGYHDAKLIRNNAIPDMTHASIIDVVFLVEPGLRYQHGITTIVARDNLEVRPFEKLVRHREGDPFLLQPFEQLLKKSERHCQNLGYKFCKVDSNVSSRVPGRKSVRLTITPGPKVYIGSIFVQGNLLTEDIVITRELFFRHGDLYQPRKIERSQRAIQRLGFFASVRIEELGYDEARHMVDLVIRVRERKQRNISVRAGFGSDQGFRLFSDFSYLNFAGTGRNLFLTTGISQQVFDNSILEWRVILTYIEPDLFGTPFNGRMRARLERDEEEFGNIDRNAFLIGIEYEIWERFLAQLNWEIEQRNPFDIRIPPEDLSDFDQSRRFFGALGTVITLDMRDNILNPRWGMISVLRANYYGKAFLSEEEFYQTFLRTTFYAPLIKNITGTLSVRIGFSETFGDTAAAGNNLVPVEKRFRLGGSNSLRGFSRDCVGGLSPNEPALCSDQPAPGGNAVFNYMAEVALPLFGDFKLVAFTDGGEAFVQNSNFDITTLRFTAGFGLRYITPVGPLRLDYGFVLDRRPGESIGQLHFAVGHF